MQELRFVAVSEDGSYAVLAVPGRSGRYILPIDERLRAVAHGQTSRLAQYEIEVESPLRPKEIQSRIRAGETAEEIADAAGIPIERVRWFEGPVLAERAYIADQAQAASVRRAGDAAGPGPRLGEIVATRLLASGTDDGDGQWDSRKRGDGNWQVSLTFPAAGRVHVAEWVFDPRRRHVMPDDDNAARLSLPESELPPEPVAVPGEATVTPIASRLGAAAGMGGGGMGGGGFGPAPGVSRFRPERSVIPDRSLGADRSLVDRPVAPPAAERSPVVERPVAERPAMSHTPSGTAAGTPVLPHSGYQDQPAHYDYAEFPESAPYRAPAPAQQPAAYRAPAQEAPAYRPPVAEPPVAPPPAFRAPEPAPAAQVPVGPTEADAERVRPIPPRPVVFEDPEPTELDEQFELAPAPAPESPAPESPAPQTTAPAARETHVPQPAPAAEPAVAPVVAVAADTVAAPAAEPATAPEPAVATPEAPATSTAAPAAVMPEPAASSAQPAAATDPASPAEDEPAGPAPAEDPSSRQRPGAKKNPKGRRSSVPSWDEIMLGSSRQRD